MKGRISDDEGADEKANRKEDDVIEEKLKSRLRSKRLAFRTLNVMAGDNKEEGKVTYDVRRGEVDQHERDLR
jgi:hypothetical protein